MSSSIIRLLPDHVANQIAAGEVVQRPASVVKELLENAVDAGASSITLVIKDAGKTLIQVVDDGKGMNETDARFCFERHATSKISLAEDLFNLQTKGFRGEALASIAAIAHVELKSKTAEDELGTHIVIEGSKVQSQEVAVLPKGTSFLVKNLFYNIPARRNFLKSDQVELRHVVDEFERVALAHPQIQFSFINNGTEMFQLPLSNLRQRIVNVLGQKINDKLVPVEETTEIVSIRGFVVKPEMAKKSRGEQFFFVNDRFVKSGYLHHAVASAFEGLLKEGTHPSYFLYLSLPPQSIDINIHPTKTEVKFDDEQALYAILRATIKHSLGQFHVSPSLDFQRDASLDIPYALEGSASSKPMVEVNTFYNPFKQDPSEIFDSKMAQSDAMPSKINHSRSGKLGNKAASNHWETLYTGLPEATEQVIQGKNHIFESDVKNETLFDAHFSETTVNNKSYQIQRKYIASPIKSGMVIIDQRRAHQRILYEQYLVQFEKPFNASQQLLFPLTLYYTRFELDIVAQMKSSLEKLGFAFDAIKQDRMVISGIPVGITESEVSIVLDDILAEWQAEMPSETTIIQDKLAKSMAQSLAVKTGTFLSDKELENMVNSLFACHEPMISPFLKPTYITLKVEDIDKKFMI